MGAVIQLSDRQQSEPRIEALAYMDETEKAAQAIRVLARRAARGELENLVGIDSVAQRLLHMVEVGREEIDRLTLEFGYPDSRGDAA